MEKFNLEIAFSFFHLVCCDFFFFKCRKKVQSSDFFWNKVTMKKALYEGVIFANSMGDGNTAASYQSTLDMINATLFDDHWTEDGSYVYESTNRMKVYVRVIRVYKEKMF
jgi:hypothetical protein